MAIAYVFGYGSLIQGDSRRGTVPGAERAWPVEVAGFQREWNYRPRHGPPWATYLGLRPRAGAVTNGVIFAVDEHDLVELDRREANYERIRVDPAAIRWLDDQPEPFADADAGLPAARSDDEHPNAESKIPGAALELPGAGVLPGVWTYACEAGHRPTAEVPLVQGYIDVCVDGCLAIEREFAGLSSFAADFVRQTVGWSEHWVNDRGAPRSPRRPVATAAAVDRVLREELGELVDRRRGE
ncbi:MAG: gamma-glutamylcyclotransferase family protein [Planctomycetota bacterium]